MLLRHSATGLLLSAAYGDDKGGAQCQSSDKLNKEAKDLIRLELPSNLRVNRKGETAEFTTNMRSGGGDIIFELYAQSEVGQCATWPDLKKAAIAAHKRHIGGGGGSGR